MRHLRSWFAAVALLGAVAGTGCHHRAGSHVSGGVLGRVVIYRNGVAFYERHARLEDGKVAVRVPRDRVDDFLKSLTVVDRATGTPLGVAIPRTQDSSGTYLTMQLETHDKRTTDVLLTYVTEAPAWKPSYRVVVGKDGKVMLEGWAVVDNTTSEDWKGVLVGVGASSALAFRYDLWSVRTVDRDLLAGEERFAVAPPTGVSPYSDTGGAEEIAAIDGPATGVSLSGASSDENLYVVDGTNTTSTGSSTTTASTLAGTLVGTVVDAASGQPLVGASVVATGAGEGSQVALTDEQGRWSLGVPPGKYTVTYFYGDSTVERSNVLVAKDKPTKLAQKLTGSLGRGEVISISGSAPTIDQGSTRTGVTITQNYTRNVPQRTFESVLGSAAGSSADGGSYTPPRPPSLDDKLAPVVAKLLKDRRDVVVEVRGPTGSDARAKERGTAIKNRLVDAGIAATKIHIVPKLEPGAAEATRVLAIAPNAKPEQAIAPPAAPGARISGTDTPVGESHFLADKPMTVRAGSSAMVAMVHRETTGGVVYLYDPISDRGDQRFAFKAVRLDNPTEDTLEPGPVTVYGDGRFIGEGITEPVPPRAAAVIPFALDKQIVVERSGAETDEIAKLVTVQRGVVTAELQHRRESRFAVTSRLPRPTTVYLRHRLESGWQLLEHPKDFTRVGDSHLFEVELAPGQTKHVTIAEATPVERTFDLSSRASLDMMKVFINDPKAGKELKAQIEALLATHAHAADLVDKITTLREQLAEYRQRSGELHAQVLSLKVVRSGGSLMAALKTKLAEMSDRTQKATIAVVEAQEQLMLARVKFANQLADLRLTDAASITRR